MTGDRRLPTRGFTLLEVVVAIALTAVAVGVAASALTTATLVKERVTEHRETLEFDVRFRSTLMDMLRHAPAADGVEEPLMRVSRTPDGSSQLVFLSTGVTPPFGNGSAWRVTVTGAASGISWTAEPLGAGRMASPSAQRSTSDGVPVLYSQLRASGKTMPALHVRFLEHTGGRSAPRWRDDWPLERARPAAISLRFSDDVTARPLLVDLNPLHTLGGLP